jgi:hypothetical protein
LSIRLTAIATWNQDDPTTWATSYYLSAAYIVFAGLAIVLLVREVPAAKELVKDHPTVRFRDTMRSVLEAPNARPLLFTLLCSVAAGGAFSRAYPIYAEDVLGAGGDALSAAGIWSAILGIAVFPLSLLLAAKLSVKHNLFWAAISGGGTALAHLWVTDLWQSVALGVFSGIFLGASGLSLAPMYLQILPRRGGLAERIGIGFAPILLAGMIAAFLAGFAYDVVVHDYRVIWIPTAVFSFGAGVSLFWMRIPVHAKHVDLRHGWRVLKRNLWGKKEGRELFRGNIDHHEADGAALIELVADELNPYVDRGL